MRACGGALRTLRSMRRCIKDPQKQPSEVLYKKAVLKNFAKFTGKHLCQSFFSVNFEKFLRTPFLQNTSGGCFKMWLLKYLTILKKRLWHRCLPVNFEKVLRAPFLQNTSGGRLCTLLNIYVVLIGFRKKNSIVGE